MIIRKVYSTAVALERRLLVYKTVRESGRLAAPQRVFPLQMRPAPGCLTTLHLCPARMLRPTFIKDKSDDSVAKRLLAELIAEGDKAKLLSRSR
jgi:hypothetical protein